MIATEAWAGSWGVAEVGAEAWLGLVVWAGAWKKRWLAAI